MSKMLRIDGALLRRCEDLIPTMKADPEAGVLFPRMTTLDVARLALIRGLVDLEGKMVKEVELADEELPPEADEPKKGARR